MSEIVYLLGGPSDLTKMVVQDIFDHIYVPVYLHNDNITRSLEISKIRGARIRKAEYQREYRLHSGAYVYGFCKII
jgi:glutamate formiminotransferase